jgi:hypothetical protein
METKKFCVNCKHIAIDEIVKHRLDLSYCGRNRTIDLVTGQMQRLADLPFCSTQRASEMNDYCGKLGKYYEEDLSKQPITITFADSEGKVQVGGFNV